MEGQLNQTPLANIQDKKVKMSDEQRRGLLKNDFLKVNQLGEGSFGKVYLVRCKVDGELYVLKRIDMSKISEKQKKACYFEASVQSKLNCDYICKYLCQFSDPKYFYIVMEYCPNGDI